MIRDIIYWLLQLWKYLITMITDIKITKIISIIFMSKDIKRKTTTITITL
jgi:hypothetical protein